MQARTDSEKQQLLESVLGIIRGVRLQQTCARCVLTRQGQNVANVSVDLYQRDEQTVAIGRAHFLLSDD